MDRKFNPADYQGSQDTVNDNYEAGYLEPEPRDFPRLTRTLNTPPPWEEHSKPRRDMFPRVLSFIAVALSAAAVALTLMHAGPAGPQGLRGATGATGAQGQTGATGPAAYDPYGYICTISNMPGFPGGGLQTGYYPCTDKSPTGN